MSVETINRLGQRIRCPRCFGEAEYYTDSGVTRCTQEPKFENDSKCNYFGVEEVFIKDALKKKNEEVLQNESE